MRDIIMRGMEEGAFPGAVVCVSRHGDPIFFEAHGAAETETNERPMSIDTRFDLGALTQVVATLPAVLRTVQMGKLSLVEPIARFLPEFATGVDRHAKGQITAFHLLTHTSGLPEWAPFFLYSRGIKAYLRALSDQPLEAVPGEKVIRSDLGYMLLGFALERIWERSLDEVCERLVFGPLELYQTCFAGTDGLPPELCAATEVGNEHENKRCQAVSDPVHFPWRGNTICGEAHDGNAFYGLDGMAGHAGLFSTAGDLSRYVEIWVRKGVYKRERFLDATLVALATACHGVSTGQGHGCGWMMSGGDGKPTAPSKSFGFTSFTGTSVWCEPLTKTTSVVLTNRMHPKAIEEKTNWCEAFHRRVFVE